MSKHFFYAIGGVALLSAGVWAYAANTENPWPGDKASEAANNSACSSSKAMASGNGSCSLTAARMASISRCPATQAKQQMAVRAAWASLPFDVAPAASAKKCDWAAKAQCDSGYAVDAKQAKDASQCSLTEAKQAKDASQCSLTKAAEAKQAKSGCCPATCDSGKAKNAVEEKTDSSVPDVKTADNDEAQTGDEIAKAE